MVILWLLYPLISCTVLANAWPTTYPYDSQTTCQKITVPLCRTNASKYDQTRLPNFISFTNQLQVKLFTEQTQIQELVKTKCSKDVVFFLCSVLLPICISESKGANGKMISPMVPPCRSLCENVYNDCIQSIRMLNFSWPGKLNCSGLPDHNEGICIAPDAFVSTTPTPAPYKLTASCARTKIRRKNLDLRSAILKRYDYIFRVKFEGKRSGPSKVPVIEVLYQSPCTSTQLPPVTHLLLDKSSCRRKFRKSDGEVLILVKKGKKQIDMAIEKIIFKMSKADMKKALQKHKCPSKKRNNRKPSGKHNG